MISTKLREVKQRLFLFPRQPHSPQQTILNQYIHAYDSDASKPKLELVSRGLKGAAVNSKFALQYYNWNTKMQGDMHLMR